MRPAARATSRACRLARPSLPLRHRLSTATVASAPKSVRLAFTEFPSMKDADFPRLRLSPVVYLHGLLGSQSNFRGIASRPEISTNRRVILPDLRNHGASPHSDDMTIEAMAADVVQLLDEVGIERATIVGHSLGGRVAMALALVHRPRLDRLVVVDMTPHRLPTGPVSLIPSIVGAMERLDLRSLTSRRDALAKLEPDIPEESTRQFVVQNLVLEGTSWKWRVNLMAIRASLKDLFVYDYGALLAKHGPFNGPSLFIGGSASSYVGPSSRHSIRPIFPSARIEVIDGAGHWVHAERPNDFVRVLAAFLDEEKREAA